MCSAISGRRQSLGTLPGREGSLHSGLQAQGQGQRHRDDKTPMLKREDTRTTRPASHGAQGSGLSHVFQAERGVPRGHHSPAAPDKPPRAPRSGALQRRAQSSPPSRPPQSTSHTTPVPSCSQDRPRGQRRNPQELWSSSRASGVNPAWELAGVCLHTSSGQHHPRGTQTLRRDHIKFIQDH